MRVPALVADDDASALDEVRTLLREYEASLPFALDFQGFDAEVAGLPGAYRGPTARCCSRAAAAAWRSAASTAARAS